MGIDKTWPASPTPFLEDHKSLQKASFELEIFPTSILYKRGNTGEGSVGLTVYWVEHPCVRR